MWEAVVAPGRRDEATAWIATHPGTAYSDGTDRIVLLRPAGQPDPVAPEGLLLRAHGWDFTEL
jgi:hypothetical protein